MDETATTPTLKQHKEARPGGDAKRTKRSWEEEQHAARSQGGRWREIADSEERCWPEAVRH